MVWELGHSRKSLAIPPPGKYSAHKENTPDTSYAGYEFVIVFISELKNQYLNFAKTAFGVSYILSQFNSSPTLKL